MSFNRFGNVKARFAASPGLGVLTTANDAHMASTVQVFVSTEGDIILQLGGNYTAENGEEIIDPNPDPSGECFVGMREQDALGLIDALARTIAQSRTRSPL